MTPQEIKQTLIDICKTSSKAKEILKRANGKNDYKEIASFLKIHPTLCSSILSQAKTFGLLTKTGNIYKKTPEFKHINIERALKGATLSLPEEKKLTVKKRKKVVITSDIKKKIIDYFRDHFKIIPHPFSPSTRTKIDDARLRKASEKLFEYIEKDIGVTQLDGLPLRFFESFAAWFSVDRIKKPN